MTWGGGCPGRVSSALNTVKGVKSATADFPTKTATIQATGQVCQKGGENALYSALKNAGYGGKVTSKK